MKITTGAGDIRVAIVGVGNCANSLVQGVTYYKDAAIDQEIPGLMHAVVGGYHISNVKFVAAFDVDSKKVGLDLADAIWASENNTIKFSDVAKTGVEVQRGKTLDGLGKYYKETITESTAAEVDVVAALKAEQVGLALQVQHHHMARRLLSDRRGHVLVDAAALLAPAPVCQRTFGAGIASLATPDAPHLHPLVGVNDCGRPRRPVLGYPR